MPHAGDLMVYIFAGCAGFAGLFLLVAVVNGAMHSHGGSHPQIGDQAHAGHALDTDHGGHLLHAAHGRHVQHVVSLGGDHTHTGHDGHHPLLGHHGHLVQTGHEAGDLGTSHDVGHGAHDPHGAHAAHAGQGGHGTHDAHDAHDAHASHTSHVTHVHQREHDANVIDKDAHLGLPHPRYDGLGSRLLSVWSGLAALAIRSINLYAVLTFLFYFGVVGIVMTAYAHAPTVLVISLSSGVGVVAAMACTALLQRLFGDTSGLVTHENSRLRGREVKVTRRIRDGGVGEVILTPHPGVAQNIPARSVDGKGIPVGQRAVIVEVNRGMALVERLDFSADAEDADEPHDKQT